MFGARGTGKSTFIKNYLPEAFRIDLLEDEWESRYTRRPDLLYTDLKSKLVDKPKLEWVFIDEVQKIPKLLDVVHRLIEEKKLKFALTGSSARKLKRGRANLLAGRAFMNSMFPLCQAELGRDFDLSAVLRWGALPKVWGPGVVDDKNEFLRTYSQTYLKEEILQEQLVRDGASFRDFMEIAALENGDTLNFSKIARDLRIDTKTVQNFFQILEDTLAGFFLPAFHKSVRKSQRHQPKFYLFDLGVKNAMARDLDTILRPGTSAFGMALEHFVVLETYRLNEYFKTDYRLAHYRVDPGGEIDLVLSKRQKVIAVEIKSTDRVDPVEVKHFARTASALSPQSMYFVSQDTVATRIADVECLHWKDFLGKLWAQNEARE